jgi:hypothetical protein
MPLLPGAMALLDRCAASLETSQGLLLEVVFTLAQVTQAWVAMGWPSGRFKASRPLDRPRARLGGHLQSTHEGVCQSGQLSWCTERAVGHSQWDLLGSRCWRAPSDRFLSIQWSGPMQLGTGTRSALVGGEVEKFVGLSVCSRTSWHLPSWPAAAPPRVPIARLTFPSASQSGGAGPRTNGPRWRRPASSGWRHVGKERKDRQIPGVACDGAP